MRRKSGFTLIELMITIAIIAILASILLPNFVKSKEKAQLEACKGNIKAITVALSLYRHDNKTVPTGAVSQTHPLVAQGYLKSRPLWPCNPNRNDSYSISASTAYPGDYCIWCINLSNTWHPTCSEASRPLLYLDNGKWLN